MSNEEDTIVGIFFSKFDKDKGPVIVEQDPPGFISKETFDVVSAHVIPKPALAEKLIAITANDLVVVGCPVVIDEESYARNRFSFNICLVFKKGTNFEPFELCVKKIAQSMKLWETETGGLSNPTVDCNIKRILSEVRVALNTDGFCSIPVDDEHFLHLKLIEAIVAEAQPIVYEYDVPIFIDDVPITDASSWVDLTVTQILPHINGVNAVIHIAQKADVDVNLVKACVQNLIYYGDVKLISVFQYSNMYMTTDGIQKLYDDVDLQKSCILKVQRKGEGEPSLRDVMDAYCSMNVGTTIRQLCEKKNLHSLNIDERKLVRFGTLHGLIRRLHRYPVKLADKGRSSVKEDLYKYCDGRHHTDDICCKLSMSFEEFKKQIEGDKSIIICYK